MMDSEPGPLLWDRQTDGARQDYARRPEQTHAGAACPARPSDVASTRRLPSSAEPGQVGSRPWCTTVAVPTCRPVRADGGRSTRRSRGAPTAPTGTGTPTSTRRPTGPFLGDVGFVWGPEGLTEADAGVARRRRRPRRARGRLRCRPVLTLGRSPRAAAPSAWTCRTASSSTPGGSTTRPGSGCPPSWAPPPTSPSPTAASTSSSAPSGRCSSSATSTGAVAETARVLRPGGRYAFSITHPTRWMFPDDPGEPGPDRQPVLLGPHAVRRDRRRLRRGGLRRAPPHPRRLGRGPRRPRLPAAATCSSRSGPRATTGSGAAGPRSAAVTPPAPRSSRPTSRR